MWGESERARAHRDNRPRRQSVYRIRKEDVGCISMNLTLRTAFTKIEAGRQGVPSSECDAHNFRIADNPLDERIGLLSGFHRLPLLDWIQADSRVPVCAALLLRTFSKEWPHPDV